MGGLSLSGGGGGSGAPTAKSATVSGTATGTVYIIARLLGGTSTISLITGTNANLTLSGVNIQATAGIGAGNSQTAIVREVRSSPNIAVEYPVVLTGQPVYPVLSPTTASFATSATAGTSIATITGLGAGETVTAVSPNDGRVAFTSGGTVTVGLTASSAGTISYTFTTSAGRQLTIAITATNAAAPYLGMNMGLVNYYTERPDLPIFLDRLKTSPKGGWGIYNNLSNVDSRGFPTDIPAGMPATTCIFYLDGPDEIYEIHYSGCTVGMPNHGFISDTGSVYTFQANPDPGLRRAVVWVYSITGPVNISIVRKDQVALWQAGNAIAPEIVDNLQGNGWLRFLDWRYVNGNAAGEDFYNNSVNNCSWGDDVPLEVIAELCNKVGAVAKVPLPIRASDAHVASVLAIFTAAGVVAEIEIGNEVWNQAYEAHWYANAQAEAMWGTGTAGMKWYAYRTGQIAKNVVKPAGHRMCLGVQSVGPSTWVDYQIYVGFQASGAADSDLYKIDIAPYVKAGAVDDLTAGHTLLATNDIDGFLDDAVSNTGAESIARNYTLDAAGWKAIADAHGWKLGCYEINFHNNTIPQYSASEAQQFAFRRFFGQAQESARAVAEMVRCYHKLHTDYGFEGICLYGFSINWTEGGLFGLYTHNQWPAVKALAQDGIVPALPTNGLPGPGTLTATPGDGKVTLNYTDGTTGGSPITGHVLYRGTAPYEQYAGVIPSFPYEITGLSNDVPIDFWVAGVNAQGEGKASNKVSATPVSDGPGYLRFETVISGDSTEGGSSGAGYSYTTTSSAERESVVAIPAGEDGWFTLEYSTAPVSKTPILSLRSGLDAPDGGYWFSGYGWVRGSGGVANAADAPPAGTKVKVARVGSVSSFYVWNGSFWDYQFDLPGVSSTGALKAFVYLPEAGTVTKLAGSSNVA